MICKCLDDENVEVREMAATYVSQNDTTIDFFDEFLSTLTGILRLSPRRSVIALKVNKFYLRSPLRRGVF